MRRRFSGRLCVRSGSTERVIDLVRGELRAARSSLEPEKLGSWLVDRGLMDDEAKALILLGQTGTSGNFGAVAVNRGLFSADTLALELQALSSVIIERAASGREVEISLEEAEEGERAMPDTLLDTSTSALLLSAAHRVSRRERNSDRFAPQILVQQVEGSAAIIADIELGGEDLKIWKALGRPVSVAELGGRLELEEEEIGDSLWAMELADLVERVDPTAKPALKPRFVPPSPPPRPLSRRTPTRPGFFVNEVSRAIAQEEPLFAEPEPQSEDEEPNISESEATQTDGDDESSGEVSSSSLQLQMPTPALRPEKTPVPEPPKPERRPTPPGRRSATAPGRRSGPASVRRDSGTTAPTRLTPRAQFQGQLNETETAEREQIIKLAEESPKLDHYRVLGIRRDATKQVIEDAYGSLAKRYDPDRCSERHLTDLELQLRSIRDRIDVARDCLIEIGSRDRYDHVMRCLEEEGHVISRAERADRQQREQVARRELVEANLKRADEFARQGDIYLAVQLLEQAVALSPEPEALLKLARLLGKNPMWAQRSLTTLKKALEVDPRYVPAWLDLAEFWRRQRDPERERKALEKALRIAPSNRDARAAFKALVGDDGLKALLRRLR